MSDGSTDGTDQIVREYAAAPSLDRAASSSRVGTAGTLRARRERSTPGTSSCAHVPYDLVGNLDADLSFDEELFAFLLEKFVEMPDLGVAGAPILEGGDALRLPIHEHQSMCRGACQLFRRECFEEIGGYVPVEGGGIDWIAVTTARMNGWKTRTFVEKVRSITGRWVRLADGPGKLWFRRGEEDYALGGHPLWQVARSVYQSTSRPYVIGGLMLLSGYAYQVLRRAQRPVSRELVRVPPGGADAQIETGRRASLAAARPGRESDPSTGGVSIDESIARLERWVEDPRLQGVRTLRRTLLAPPPAHVREPVSGADPAASRPPEPRQCPPAARHQAARINQGPRLHGMGVSRVAAAHRQASGTGKRPSPAWSG